MKNRETFNFYRSFFDSASEAKKDGFNQGHISAVCMGNEKNIRDIFGDTYQKKIISILLLIK